VIKLGTQTSCVMIGTPSFYPLKINVTLKLPLNQFKRLDL
jgi:hypothetical protein